MPFNRIENREFIYFLYSRANQKDLERFRREMTNAASITSGSKDVVVDLTGSTSLSSPEISIMIRLLKVMDGTLRSLRIIAPAEIRKILCSTNIQKLKNLVIYDDQNAFVAHLKQQTHGDAVRTAGGAEAAQE